MLAQRILKKICQLDCDARLALGGMPPSLRMHVAALSRAPCRAADRASSYVTQHSAHCGPGWQSQSHIKLKLAALPVCAGTLGAKIMQH